MFGSFGFCPLPSIFFNFYLLLELCGEEKHLPTKLHFLMKKAYHQPSTSSRLIVISEGLDPDRLPQKHHFLVCRVRGNKPRDILRNNLRVEMKLHLPMLFWSVVTVFFFFHLYWNFPHVRATNSVSINMHTDQPTLLRTSFCILRDITICLSAHQRHTQGCQQKAKLAALFK